MNCTINTTCFMSNFCLSAWENEVNEVENCFPDIKNHVFLDILLTFNTVVGLSCNLLTILAIPYAAKMRKLEFSLLLFIILIRGQFSTISEVT